MTCQNDIDRLVEQELASITDVTRRSLLQSILIAPRMIRLKWDYGLCDEQYECWMVGMTKDNRGLLIYCDKGFGPNYPWGIINANLDSMGMDSDWHNGLEHAAIAAGILNAPSGYDVP